MNLIISDPYYLILEIVSSSMTLHHVIPSIDSIHRSHGSWFCSSAINCGVSVCDPNGASCGSSGAPFSCTFSYSCLHPFLCLDPHLYPLHLPPTPNSPSLTIRTASTIPTIYSTSGTRRPSTESLPSSLTTDVLPRWASSLLWYTRSLTITHKSSTPFLVPPSPSTKCIALTELMDLYENVHSHTGLREETTHMCYRPFELFLDPQSSITYQNQ